MSKHLHAALAWKEDAQAKFENLAAEHTKKFQAGNNYKRVKRAFRPIGENAKEVDETSPAESVMASTVIEDLSWLFDEAFSDHVDNCYQINVANTSAKADLVVDGITLLTAAPSTALLELKKQVSKWRAIINATPQLEDKGYVKAEGQKHGVYKVAIDVVKSRTALDKVPYTLAAATDKFPAQVQLHDKHVITGETSVSEWSSALSVAQRAEALGKIDKLLRAIKEAITEANQQAVPQDKPSLKLRDYLLGDLLLKK